MKIVLPQSFKTKRQICSGKILQVRLTFDLFQTPMTQTTSAVETFLRTKELYFLSELTYFPVIFKSLPIMLKIMEDIGYAFCMSELRIGDIRFKQVQKCNYVDSFVRKAPKNMTKKSEHALE